MNSISNDLYEVNYGPEDQVVKFDGSLRLKGLNEYQPISDLLKRANENSPTLTLNVKNLEFLNSSGIAMFCKFIIGARQSNDNQITIVGSAEVPWQAKSLNNLKRLMPKLELVFE